MAAEVTLGWNNDKLLAGSKQAEAIVQRTSAQMQTSLSKVSGGGSLRGIGQASLQVQDIAVQLAAGAKASTVLAQQGTQILSAFGAGGAIAGGALAIGVGFYQMGERALEAFQKAKKGSEEFNQVLGRILASARPEELAGKWSDFNTSIQETNRQLGKEKTLMEDLGDVFAVINSLGRVSLQNINDQRAQTQLDALRGMASIEARLIQLGQQNLDITTLRANGKQAEADELQRQIELSAKLFQIQQSQFSSETKAALANQAAAASNAAARAAATSKAFADTQRLIDAQNKLEGLKRAAALESASIYDREKLIKQEITAEEERQAILRADFVPDQLAILSSEERLLRLKQDLQRTQRQIADDAWRAAEAQDAARKAAQDEATAKININGTAPATGSKITTKAKQSARESTGLTGFYDLQNGPNAFQRLQQQPSAYQRSQQGMSAFQRLQFKAAQDRAGGPIMPLPGTRTAPQATGDAGKDTVAVLNRMLSLWEENLA